jgi:hypothetical protein
MPINKDTHVTAQTVLTTQVHDKIKELAKENKRSVSSQIAFMLEENLERKEKPE